MDVTDPLSPAGGARPGFRVVVQLARAEARCLLRHPLFLITIPFLVLGMLTLPQPFVPVLTRDDIVTAASVGIALGVAAYFALNAAALRSRRGADELYGSTPVDAGTRTAGQLLDRPVGGVAHLVEANWERLTDPATPVQDLVRSFGFRPVAKGALPEDQRGEVPRVAACP